jgi:cytochrome P450
MNTVTNPSKFDPSNFDPSTFNPHDPDFIRDPYPIYEWFRNHQPVSKITGYFASYWVFRYESVKSILDNKTLWVKQDPLPPTSMPPGFEVLANLPGGIFSIDNPRHDQVRAEIQPYFHDSILDIASFTNDVIKPLVKEIKAKRRFELIEGFATTVPSQALAHVLGVPEKDWPVLTQWIAPILLASDPGNGPSILAMGATTSMALRSYFHALLAGQVIKPVKGKMIDLMSRCGEPSATKISRDEVVSNASTMAIAGYFSTAFLVGTGIYTLLNKPDVLDLLRQEVKQGNQDALRRASAEMLRFESPVQLLERYAAEDTEIEGVRLDKGQKVSVVLGSANRDPQMFSDPDTFDISRDPAAILSFGDGMHRCLGEPLFYQVVPAALTGLLGDLPPFELAGNPQWQTNPTFRAINNLPLQFVS